MENENLKGSLKSLIVGLIDKKLSNVLEFFFDNPKERFYLKQISKATGVSNTSTFRILKRLCRLGIVREEVVGPAKLYFISEKKEVMMLSELFKPKKSVIEQIKEGFAGIGGIDYIVIYGKAQNGKATVFLIGPSPNGKEIESAKERVEKSSGLLINYITLTDIQFNQMSRLGLYPDEKRVIWKRES